MGVAIGVEYLGQRGGETRTALRRAGFSAQELDSCSVRWRSGFPRIAGPLVLSSGCWVHDGFQMLSGLSDSPALATRCRCQAATEHRTNIAHLVLHSIWNDELSSGKGSQKGHKHRARLERTPGLTLMWERMSSSAHAFAGREFLGDHVMRQIKGEEFIRETWNPISSVFSSTSTDIYMHT